MTRTTHQVLLAERPTGFPDESTWRFTTTDVPDVNDGEFLVKVQYLSIDPAMRGWLNDVRSYIPPVQIDEVMRALAVGEVVESKHPEFAVGQSVLGAFGVTEYVVSEGTGVQVIDTSVADGPTWLGALGMPGMTSYFGLQDVGQIKAGDTLVVSGAAGAVGSVVGQIGKALGATVIGIAGGPDKCAWLTDELGFDAAIDYKNENVTRRLREIATSGIDVFFDNVGGPVLDSALANLARGARVVICGGISSYNESSLPPGPSRYMSLLVFRASMTGFVVFDYEDRFGEAVEKISAWIADGTLVAREHVIEGGVAAFPEALTQLFAGANTGKMVLKV